jgi:aryl-alcohol dehydrogenase-like predicted oxidoreductase
MKKRNLGSAGTTVSAVGIGAMSFSDFYGPTDTEKSHAILRKALEDLGIDHIDTSNVYGPGVSEERIGSFLKHQGVRKNDLFKRWDTRPPHLRLRGSCIRGTIFCPFPVF